jgi:rhamnogalacturonyl hydrolase YesR
MVTAAPLFHIMTLRNVSFLLGLVSVLPGATRIAAEPPSGAPPPATVLATMEKVADWQLANPSKHPVTGWVQAAGYAGMMALSNLSKSPRYHDAMLKMAEDNKWQLPTRTIKNPSGAAITTGYDGDDHCVGQTYAELFFKHRDPRMLAGMVERFDHILAHPKDDNLLFDAKANPGHRERWSWCDSLFMAPPSWLRLWVATGQKKYLDFMAQKWWVTSDYLYDKEEHLYFRDSTYFTKKEANGKKVFWSRGNGWVMGGLVRVLQYLPKDHPARAKFERQYREMAAKLLTLQQPDGLWRSSLLDPASYPLQETSGSSFFTYALAYGANEGLLDRAQAGAAALKAWQALTALVTPEGKLTHVQPIGADPKKFDPASTEPYGVGAFLLAGSEIHRLAGGKAPGKK